MIYSRLEALEELVSLVIDLNPQVVSLSEVRLTSGPSVRLFLSSLLVELNNSGFGEVLTDLLPWSCEEEVQSFLQTGGYCADAIPRIIEVTKQTKLPLGRVLAFVRWCNRRNIFPHGLYPLETTAVIPQEDQTSQTLHEMVSLGLVRNCQSLAQEYMLQRFVTWTDAAYLHLPESLRSGLAHKINDQLWPVTPPPQYLLIHLCPLPVKDSYKLTSAIASTEKLLQGQKLPPTSVVLNIQRLGLVTTEVVVLLNNGEV